MKTQSHFPRLFIFCALPCEAKPLIDSFKLKKVTTLHAFNLFRNHETILTVTGIGKTAMAAGVAYTLALNTPAPNPVLMNVGIAGHKSHAVGSLFLIDKITDADSQKHFYPPIIYTPPCPTHSLQTAAKPQTTYDSADLLDMEGAAFYETATRFTTSEFIASLKIISDNAHSPIDHINPSFVTALIADQLTAIQQIITTLTQLNAPPATVEPSEYQTLLDTYHFTVNQQTQLKKLLQRQSLVLINKKPEIDLNAAKNAQDYLQRLEFALNKADFSL